MHESAPRVCPKCGKSNIVSNHLDSHAASHGVGHYLGHQFGHNPNPAMLGISAAAWLIQQGINLASERWVCEDCGHPFTPDSPAQHTTPASIAASPPPAAPPQNEEKDNERSFLDELFDF